MTILNATEQQKMQRLKLDDIGEWSIRWDLRFHVDKCKVFHIGWNNPRAGYNPYVKNIKNAEEEYDVSVLMTPDLRPTKMVARVASGANQVLGAWSRAVLWQDMDNDLQDLHRTKARIW